MANTNDSLEKVVSGFHKLSSGEKVKWLQSAIRGDVPELILSPGDTPREGLEVFARRLERAHGEHLSLTAVRYLEEWIATSARKPQNAHLNDTVATLLDILAFDPASVSAKFLHEIIMRRTWFDLTPKSLRLALLNALESQRDLAPRPLLEALLKWRPSEYGVYVFCILAAQDFRKALEILPNLPDTYDVRNSLSMSVDWLLEIFSPNARTNNLTALANALVACPEGVRIALTESFKQADCPLPEVSAPRRLTMKFFASLHTLMVGERVPVTPCKSLFCHS